MGKHYAIEFQLQVLQPILKGKMDIREAARFYHIPSGTLSGIKGPNPIQYRRQSLCE